MSRRTMNRVGSRAPASGFTLMGLMRTPPASRRRPASKKVVWGRSSSVGSGSSRRVAGLRSSQ